MELKNIDRESKQRMDAAYQAFLRRVDKLTGEGLSGKLGLLIHFHNDAYKGFNFVTDETVRDAA